MNAQFHPVIIAFCCHWCSYAAADLAGVSRVQYPVNLRIIKVPCSGRVDPVHVLQAFRNGADGVLVTGCLEGGCHYISGNLRAKSRIQKLNRDLQAIGLGGRLEIQLLSAAMGSKFAEIAREFTHRIELLGPNPFKPR